MKKHYESPELNVKAYAQFENVFTSCTPSLDMARCTQDGLAPVGDNLYGFVPGSV